MKVIEVIMRRALAVQLLAIGGVSVASAQTVPARIEIVRDGVAPFVITGTELAAMPHTTVQASDHGKPVTFSGVPLVTLLRRAGVAVDSLKGPMLSSIVVATATDGYRATFSLGELAPDLGRTVVYVVDQHDGTPLAAAEGPIRLVVPSDQRPARWVRQVIRIAVRRVEP